MPCYTLDEETKRLFPHYSDARQQRALRAMFFGGLCLRATLFLKFETPRLSGAPVFFMFETSCIRQFILFFFFFLRLLSTPATVHLMGIHSSWFIIHTIISAVSINKACSFVRHANIYRMHRCHRNNVERRANTQAQSACGNTCRYHRTLWSLIAISFFIFSSVSSFPSQLAACCTTACITKSSSPRFPLFLNFRVARIGASHKKGRRISMHSKYNSDVQVNARIGGRI